MSWLEPEFEAPKSPLSLDQRYSQIHQSVVNFFSLKFKHRLPEQKTTKSLKLNLFET